MFLQRFEILVILRKHRIGLESEKHLKHVVSIVLSFISILKDQRPGDNEALGESAI